MVKNAFAAIVVGQRHWYNKSAAEMQHTPQRDIFNAKEKIVLKLDLFMQSLKKIGKEMPKIENENPIYNVNQGP